MANNTELEKIITYVQKLEKRITKLESEKAVIINGNLANKSPKSLEISLTQLIDFYNDVSHILDAYAVTVSLSEESYRKQTEGKIILNQVNKGNYWVILLENDEGKNYYLLPNGNIQLKIYRLKTINYLFLLRGEENNKEEEFTLVKPAMLEILPSGNEWQIKQKGELFLGKKTAIKKIVLGLQNLTNNEDKIPASLEQLLTVLEKLNQGNSQLAKDIKFLDNRLKKLEPAYVEYLNLYYENPVKFAESEGGFTKLKLTKDTVKNFLENKINNINLEANSQGEYILKKVNNEEFLFLDPQIIFDKMTLKLANYTKLFIADNEIPVAVSANNILIKKPAKLRKNGDIWLLIESGEISF
ncbi:MAG: hypothetical protein GW795_09875 [Cyanobacteria bacterium]|nr:hypothetical protein [Cyanobacteria bacterium CG_2015-16_32_12]NCO77774.1 hypothetical protein [Cyanobacteria bacterium CG_2015-22_32_23]NCQ04214.1 hypothetical protein [Cyanobacteria bacterium CG_2015-09_32_10]NCQ42177.1 hypothetical protein [Cyanobacteria bacterium CG_2015-04_32_10]NCS83397.1 hypothetical protein [Cyanobacteria bacterium CG_2015-02_32_10]